MTKADKITTVAINSDPVPSSTSPLDLNLSQESEYPPSVQRLGLLHPVTSNLPFIDKLAKQASYLSASTSNTFGTLVATKHNSKPFMVGFIAPDVPVNYRSISTSLAKKNMQVDYKQPGGDGSDGPGVNPIVTGSGINPIPRKLETVKSKELKTSIAKSIFKATGKNPDPKTVSLVYAHMASESGNKPGSSNFSAPNYNFLRLQGGGGRVYLDKKPSSNQSLPSPAGNPTFRSVYIGSDSENGQYYSTYMQSYDDLQNSTDSQVSQLFKQWPGTSSATSIDEYVNALYPQPEGSILKSFNFSPEDQNKYKRAIQSRLNKQPSYSEPVQTVAASSDEALSNQNVTIMNNGDSSGAEQDALNLNYDRVNPDDKRQQAVQPYIDNIAKQIEDLRSTPPLLMLVNPSNFDRSYQHSVDSSIKTRQGHIVHMWLERPVSISCSGVTAGQYVLDIDGNGGITQTNRIQSLSYQNLLSLVYTYKNNGIIYDQFTEGSKGVPILACSIFIYYDNKMYIGSFDDFSVDDDANKPNQLSYSFKFNVRYEVEVTLTDSSITSQLGF